VPLARRFFRLTTCVTLATVMILQVSLLVCRDAIARFYSSVPEVQEQISQVLVLVTFILFFDCM